MQDWWNAEQPSSATASGSQSTVPQDAAKNEPPKSVAAVTVETQEKNARKRVWTVRGAKPGLMTSLFVGACLLIGALGAKVPPLPTGMFHKWSHWVSKAGWSIFT